MAFPYTVNSGRPESGRYGTSPCRVPGNAFLPHSPMAHILIVEASTDAHIEWVRMCRSQGHRVSRVNSQAAALETVSLDTPDLVLLDLGLPQEASWRLLADLTQDPRRARVVAHTASATIEDAVAAMRAGAFHFLTQPEALESVEEAIEQALPRGIVEVAEDTDSPMIGQSPAICRVMEQVQRVARAPKTTTLITGESGVGKEVVARAIHEGSNRSQHPFVAINCAALTESLVEAELFGYEAGAFTGGDSKGRQGLIAAAEGGTLLLDEIGEMPLGLQAKLLRVLQERCYRPVGGNHDLPMDVRIVASTNRDLLEMVEAGGFREDLYYRLNVLSIQVPPLRERGEDIPHLASRFLNETARTLSREFSGFTHAAMKLLQANPWSGNVRELKNVIERAAIFTETDCIDAPDLDAGGVPSEHARTTNEASLPLDSLRLRDVEQRLIEHVLVEVDGNRSRAARELGINRATLYNKLRAYGIATAAG
ncbi:MAG: DNA-binding NtrC family response regulator [Chlamydiales bacterium]|jgi:DNA-binding NtrC family response regulator